MTAYDHPTHEKDHLKSICEELRTLYHSGDWKRCEEAILKAMHQYPHAAEPHNLMGILLERLGEHGLAMRHFRAAWALDPNFLPASENLEHFGAFSHSGGIAFSIDDCPEAVPQEGEKHMDASGIIHCIRKGKKYHAKYFS